MMPGASKETLAFKKKKVSSAYLGNNCKITILGRSKI